MKKLISTVLIITIIISVFSFTTIKAFAIGNYGVNLDSSCYSTSNPFKDYRGQCTWYAWGRAFEKTGTQLGYRGNAKTWTSGAVSTPRANSIVVWTGGKYGHVAFVEAYDGTNIYISEANRVSLQYSEGYINLSTGRFTFTYGGSGSYIVDLPYGYIHVGGNPDPTPDFTTIYMGEHFYANIIHSKSGKAVVATGDNTGDNVQLGALNGTLIQKWEFVHQKNNAYKIFNNHSGKCLDVDGCSDANNTNVHIWDSNGSLAQLWYFREAVNGYSLVPKCALGSALDLKGGNTTEGANFEIFAYQGSSSEYHSNQTFSLNYLPSFEAQNLGQQFFANIIHSKSGKVVVAKGDNVELGTIDGSLLQRWKFVRQNDWSYRINNCQSSKCLDVDGCSDANNTNVHIWNSNGSLAQLWFVRKEDSGYSLVPKCALTSALDVKGGNTNNGTNIEIFAYQNSASEYHSNQVFSIFDVNDLGEHFYANILHSKSGKAVVVVGDNVQLGTLDGTQSQKWEFVRQSDWSYKIFNCQSGKCLDVDGCTNANNTNIHVWNSNGSLAQLWYFREAGEGYSLVPKCALNSALDLKGGNTADGANIEIYAYQGINSEYHSNQSFTLKLLSTEEDTPTDPPTNPPTEPPTNPPTTPPTEPPTEPSIIKLGDVDGDDVVTIIDATCIQRKLASMATAKFVEAAADADGDGEFSILDATEIQRYLAQLPANENIGKPIA